MTRFLWTFAAVLANHAVQQLAVKIAPFGNYSDDTFGIAYAL